MTSRHLDATEAFMHGVEMATSKDPVLQVAGLLALERVFADDSFYRERAEAWLRLYEESTVVKDSARPTFDRLLTKVIDGRWEFE